MILVLRSSAYSNVTWRHTSHRYWLGCLSHWQDNSSSYRAPLLTFRFPALFLALSTCLRYYLLATGGVNADQLTSTINAVDLTGTFEPLLPLSDTDVEVCKMLSLLSSSLALLILHSSPRFARAIRLTYASAPYGFTSLLKHELT